MVLPNLLLELGRDLTNEAKEGKIENIIGRDTEIRNLVKILSLKKKNNPIILGDAGIGKTALVEGLAIRIINKDVPESLQNKEIFELDLNTLNSYRNTGQLESIIKQMMEIIKGSNGKILIFIDEIHRITGDGISDIGNLLKPYLARNFGVIGCTTLDEFRFIEKDPALDRRFQKLVITEPTIEDTISILRGVKETYELYHKVTIKDSALISASKMTDRYITDKFLPDKALSILDEACATLRVALDSKPDEIYNLEQECFKLNVEYKSLVNETDYESLERIEEIKQKYIKAKNELDHLTEIWEQDKKLLEQTLLVQERRQTIKKQLDKINSNNMENVPTDKVTELMSELNKLDNYLEELTKIKEERIKEGSILKSDVDADRIAEAISMKTGIPVNRMLTEDKEKILNLPAELEKRVIGQNEAINTVFKGILRSKSGIQNRKRPNSYLFLGTTGTGKAQPINTVIPTPKGDKQLIELKVNDLVFDRLGNKTKVLGIYHQGFLNQYKIIFNDGRETICNNEHLWTYLNQIYNNFETSSLNYLIEQDLIYKIKIPINSCLQLEYINDSTNLYEFGRNLNLNIETIPEKYFYYSYNQKLEIIKGIFDSTGYLNVDGLASIIILEEKIVYNMRKFLNSMGYIVFIKNHELTIQTKYPHVFFTKNQTYKKIENIEEDYLTITKVEKLPEKVEMLCIYVDNQEHLYLTNDYIVTHNTELAKAVCEQLYDSENSIIRIDMSEYMEKHSASRLIGPPPGYVGYEEGGQLTESVYRNPYSLVLFDEIEKAHPDVLLTLLQVLDDGRLTDGKGRIIDFKNTLIIMTSNLGSMLMINDNKNYGYIRDETKDNIKDILNSTFRPEFINRIDNLIYFNMLNKETIYKIIDKQLKDLNKRLNEELKITITISDKLKEYISIKGYEPEFGARPLVRFFEDSLETELALKIMKEDILPQTALFADIDNNEKIIIKQL